MSDLSPFGDEGSVQLVDPRPRRRVQMHLSTALVLMFVAGAFVGANVLHTTSKYYSAGDLTYGANIHCFYYGWPFRIVEFREVSVYQPEGEK